MKPGISAITSSKYYHPAFNSAIFDGPIRIYFVQFHETFALKIYFSIQEQFRDRIANYKDVAKKMKFSMHIMIYPTEDSFNKAFSLNVENKKNLARVQDPEDTIIGLLAPVADENVRQLMEELSDIFTHWESQGMAEIIYSEESRVGNSPDLF